MKTIRIIALFRAQSGKEAALKDFLGKFIEPTLKEEGCIAYELHQNTSDAADFIFIEEWASHASIDAHMKSPHIQAALPKVGEYLSAPPDIRRYEIC